MVGSLGTTGGRHTHKGSRRWLVAILTILTLVLAACGGGAAEEDPATDAEEPADEGAEEAPAEDPAAEERDSVELTMGLFGDFGYDPLIEEYEEQNPHVTVTTNITEFADHHDALTTALAAGSGAPDIAAIEVGFIAGHLDHPQNFHNLLDLGAAELEDDYLPWKWAQASTLDGSAVIGLPTDVGGMAMCYRQDLFGEAGLPSDRDEVGGAWSGWDGYLELGREYVAETGRFWANNGGVIFTAVMGQVEEGFYNFDGDLIYHENPAVRGAFDIAADAVEEGLTAGIELWSGEWNAGMADGTYATLTCPAWMRGHMQGQEPPPGAWDIAALPGGGGNWGGSFLTLPAQGDNADEAYAFISWLLAPEQQFKVFEGTGNFPSTPELYDRPEIQEFTAELFGDAPFGQIYAEGALQVPVQAIGPQTVLIGQEFENALARIGEGSETREEAWQSAIEAVDRLTGRQ